MPYDLLQSRYRRNKVFERGVKNKNTIINILLESIFSNNKNFAFYKKLEDNYKKNLQKNQFETPKKYSYKNSDKTYDNEININSKQI